MTKENKIKAIEEQMAFWQKELDELRNPPKEVWVPSGSYTFISFGEIDEHPKYTQRNFLGSYATHEQALKAKPQLRAFARLLAYVAEFDADWEADWSDAYQEKYYIRYHYGSSQWVYAYEYRCKHLQVYMSKQCAKDLVDKLNSGKVVL